MMSRLVISITALAFSGFLGQAQADPDRLRSIDADLQTTFSDIGHLSTAAFAELQSQAKSIVIVDVRTENEFSVSRIDGAVRISPGASAQDVAALLNQTAPGRDVVFYCSVGVRSSRLASRSSTSLKALGAKGVYNLRGGIFAWHNEARPLVDDHGVTLLVHPYNNTWARLLDRIDFVSKQPDSTHVD